jgi:hypothetical protein
MKRLEHDKIAGEVNPAGRWDFDPAVVTRSRSGALEELKERLLRETTWVGSDPRNWTWLRRAAEDAASLAWATPYPLLVLPELFSELAAEARAQSERQRDILRRSLRLIGLEGR